MKRWLSIFFLGMFTAAVATVWGAGTRLFAPANRPVVNPPPELGAELVEFGGAKGWLLRGESRGLCIALMHGIRSDRSSMLERARFLRKAGYSILLFDFQAHGESPGERITFGFRESRNAHEAVSYLQSRIGCKKIGVIGRSMGGAASLLGESPLKVDALVLESVYPGLEDAVQNRLILRSGKIGRYLAPLLTWQISPRLGIRLDQLRPLSAIKNLRSPVFIISGSDDNHTSAVDTAALFAAAPSPKELWIVDQAKHVDLHEFAREPYERKILGFMEKYLRRSE